MKTSKKNVCGSSTASLLKTSEFFDALFRAWGVNPGAALILTFLVQAYRLAYEMLKILARSRIGAQLLKQLTWLVQLLDSPAFVRKF